MVRHRVVAPALLAVAASASVGFGQIIAEDAADDVAYAFAGWAPGTNGGTGFGPWAFDAVMSDGFAGSFLGAGEDSPISAGEGFNWGLFANNGSGREASAAFRPLASSIVPFEGLFLEASIQNLQVADPALNGATGRTGYSIRGGATASSVDDVVDDADAIFEFFLEGGDSTYTIVDALGELDTGLPSTFDGIVVQLFFKSETVYDLTLIRLDFDFDFFSNITVRFEDREIAPGSTITNLAFFNDDGGATTTMPSEEEPIANGDVRVNSLEISIQTADSFFELDVNQDRETNIFDLIEFLRQQDIALGS